MEIRCQECSGDWTRVVKSYKVGHPDLRTVEFMDRDCWDGVQST